MKSNRHTILSRAIRKAHSSTCRYKVVAVGLDYRNRVISIACNRQRHMPVVDSTRTHWHGSGHHAEEILLHNTPRSLSRILIARVNPSGTRLLPIHPCPKCARLARKFGVTIEPLEPQLSMLPSSIPVTYANLSTVAA